MASSDRATLGHSMTGTGDECSCASARTFHSPPVSASSRGEDSGWWAWLTLAGRNVEGDICGMSTVTERIGVGDFDRRQPLLSTVVRMSTICRLPSVTRELQALFPSRPAAPSP